MHAVAPNIVTGEMLFMHAMNTHVNHAVIVAAVIYRLIILKHLPNIQNYVLLFRMELRFVEIVMNGFT